MPPAQDFCVYPQFEENLEGLAKLNISPKPDTLFRVNFIIVPEDTRQLTKTKFKHTPKKDWQPTARPKLTGFTAMEWGMGFLVGLPRKSASTK